MEIRKLEKNDPEGINLFRSFPFRLYAKNKFWVPPFPGEIERVMSTSDHPYYEHSDADFFIVCQEGLVVGRIAVLHNRLYCDYHQVNSGFFYYFDSVDDPEVAGLLFSTAEEWCRKKGLECLIGPKGFISSNGAGVLVEGFDQLPAVGIPYNYPYYQSLIESAGFQKSHDHHSGYLDRHPNSKIHVIAEKVLTRGNFRIKHFDHVKDTLEWIPRVDEIQQRAFSENPNYYPTTQQDFELLAKNILEIADPKYLKIILHGEDIAGFLIAYPNINHALQRAKGRLFPFGWLYLLLEKSHPTILDINGVGLLPEYQGLGGNALLYAELDNVTSNTRVKKAEIVQVDERNLRSKSDMEAMGVVFSKTHRTYFKKII